MSKNLIELDKEQLEPLRLVALSSKRPSKTFQDKVDLAIEISLKFIQYLDDEDFQQITGLKK